MSNTDSFVDEVNEELRQDRLWAALRRYGWIGIVGVLLLVGGAAYTEWRSAQDRAAAQALGDALNAATSAEDFAALDGVVAQLRAAAALAESGDIAGARQAYAAIAQETTLGHEYRDLAVLRAGMIAEDPAAARADFEQISAPGAPYRLLAQEQIAMIDLEAGARDEAIAQLQSITEDAEAQPGQVQRIALVLVTLGATGTKTDD